MKRQFALWILIVCVWAVPSVVRADSACDSVYAQNLARQGYSYLDERRWNDARMAAGQLAIYAKSCSDPKVGFPSVVHSAYIGTAALHAMGDDARASQALQMGMMVIDVLKKDSRYSSLVGAMEPKFAALAHEIKPPVAHAQPAPAVSP